jgi:hypothetical protein
MTDTKDLLNELVCEWASEQSWDCEDSISSIIASTNSIFTEEYCDDVEIYEGDDLTYDFTCSITLNGEPRKDDVPFCGDTINVHVEGSLVFNEDEGGWNVCDDFEVHAELEDYSDPDYFENHRADYRDDPIEHIIKQRSFSSADDLINALSELPVKSWFRGHSDESWPLKPSIAREVNPSSALEKQLKLEFENQTTFLDPASHPLGIGKCNFLMQHHGLPTRLLDWTTSPLVALYFAVCNKKHDDKDACLWVLDPSQLNRFYKEAYPLECDGKNENLYIDNTDTVFAIHAPYTNLRMKMQRSEFTVHTHYNAIEGDVSASVFLKEKIIVSKALKNELRNKLRSLGIDRSFLFPDLDNIAITVKENILEDTE